MSSAWSVAVDIVGPLSMTRDGASGRVVRYAMIAVALVPDFNAVAEDDVAEKDVAEENAAEKDVAENEKAEDQRDYTQGGPYAGEGGGIRTGGGCGGDGGGTGHHGSSP